jgi:plastocyanin
MTTTYGSFPGSASPTAASSQVHQVVVGGPNKLYYDPSNITAQVGDVIQFQFQQKNHTVTQVRYNLLLDVVPLVTDFCSRHLQALAAL